MSLLSVCRDVCRRVQVNEPSAIISASDSGAKKLLTLATESAKNIIRQFDWTKNMRDIYFTKPAASVTSITLSGATATVTTAAAHNMITGCRVLIVGADQSAYNIEGQVTVTGTTTFTYQVSGSPTSPATGTITYFSNIFDLPTDFQRAFAMTAWDTFNRWQLFGPATPADWANYTNNVISAPVRRLWRLRNDKFEIFPINPYNTTATTFQINLQYASKAICTSASGTPQTEWLADGDTFVLDEQLLYLDMTWRYLSSLNLAYGEQKANYEAYVMKFMADDGSAPMLDASLDNRRVLFNLPETGYGISN